MEIRVIKTEIIVQQGMYMWRTVSDRIPIKVSSFKQRIFTDVEWMKRWLPVDIILEVDDQTK